MRRELRRHPPTQEKQKPSRTARPARAVAGAAPSATPRSAPPTRSRSPLPAGGLKTMLRPQWSRDVISELKKVSWPTREQTLNLTMVVVVVSAFLGLLLGGLDYGFNWLFENTVLR